MPPTEPAGYAHRTVTKAPGWHALVAWDVLFNNLTTGLFLAAAVSELTDPERFTAVARAAYPIALGLLLVDLVLLVLDLGDPLRFHHMLRMVKLGSPMSLGVWSLTIYSLPATVAAALSLLPTGGTNLEWVRKAAVIAGIVPALASAVYKGVLFSTSAQPVWRDARWLGGYLTAAALMLGCAELLGLAILLREEAAVALLRPALAVLLAFSLLPLGLLLAGVRTDLRRVRNRGQLARASALAIGGGMAVPLCLLLVGGDALVLGAVALILIGSLVLRFAIVYAPHEVG